MDGTDAIEQRGYHRVGRRPRNGHCVDICTIQHGLDAEGIAHTGNIRSDGAVAERNQSPGMRPHFLDLHQIVFVRDRALDQRDIHLFGKVFAIDQRAVNQIDLPGQFKKPIVDIEERHVATRAAIQPDRRECLFVTHSIHLASESGKAGTNDAWTFQRPSGLSR